MNYSLVTGASSGLGLEFAAQLAAKKRNLVLVARNESKLREIAAHLEVQHQIQVVVLPKDLSQNNAVFELLQELQEKEIDIDILINNAGLGDLADFCDAEAGKIHQMLQVNTSALTQLTHGLAPSMVQRQRGYILNVASTAAFQPGPGMAVYFATKAYVHSFTQALRAELKNSKIHVTTLCPGPTSTNFGNVAGAKVTDVFAKFSPDAKEVVRQALRGLIDNKAMVIPGTVNKIGVCLARHLPISWGVALTGRIFRKGVQPRQKTL